MKNFLETSWMKLFVETFEYQSFRLSEEDLALVKSFEDKDGMIEYQKFLETII